MITFKKAQVVDVQLIRDMAEVVFRQTYFKILSSDQMDYMMEWMYSIPNLKKQIAEGHVFYLAFEGNIPKGYSSVQYQGKDEGGTDVFHLHKLYVMPDSQGMGIGKAMFERIIEHVREHKSADVARVELNVNRYNKAFEFYCKQGMRILAQGDFPIGNGFYMNDYIMGMEVI